MDQPISLTDDMQCIRFSNTVVVRNVQNSINIRKLLYQGKRCYVCGGSLDDALWIVSKGGGGFTRQYFHVECWNRHNVDFKGDPLWALRIVHSDSK